jgi:hypothetical protein
MTDTQGTADGYRDRWISCTADAVRIRGYYFPWGAKTIPYTAIRSALRVPVGPLTGAARIWGTANPRLWASLDPGRMGKSEGFVLDVGRRVRPFITPDDPSALEAVLRAHAVPTSRAGARVV